MPEFTRIPALKAPECGIVAAKAGGSLRDHDTFRPILADFSRMGHCRLGQTPMKEAPRRSWWRGLFGKYVLSLVGLVVILLVLNGGLETWFMYRDTTELLAKAQSEKAESTARQIEQFVSEIERQIHARRGKVVSVTRHTANPVRSRADMSLLVSAHDDRAHIQPLLYQAVLQHLLDLVFIMLCEKGSNRLEHFTANVKRVQRLLES